MAKIIDRKIVKVELHQGGAHRIIGYNDGTELNVYTNEYLPPPSKKSKSAKK